jgi:hypothetical protein
MNPILSSLRESGRRRERTDPLSAVLGYHDSDPDSIASHWSLPRDEKMRAIGTPVASFPLTR